MKRRRLGRVAEEGVIVKKNNNNIMLHIKNMRWKGASSCLEEEQHHTILPTMVIRRLMLMSTKNGTIAAHAYSSDKANLVTTMARSDTETTESLISKDIAGKTMI